MKKFGVNVTTVGYYSQYIEVEAENELDAETKVFEEELWDKGEWKFDGLSDIYPPEVDFVEEL
jgi:hypothetical protein